MSPAGLTSGDGVWGRVWGSGAVDTCPVGAGPLAAGVGEPPQAASTTASNAANAAPFDGRLNPGPGPDMELMPAACGREHVPVMNSPKRVHRARSADVSRRHGPERPRPPAANPIIDRVPHGGRCLGASPTTGIAAYR